MASPPSGQPGRRNRPTIGRGKTPSGRKPAKPATPGKPAAATTKTAGRGQKARVPVAIAAATARATTAKAKRVESTDAQAQAAQPEGAGLRWNDTYTSWSCSMVFHALVMVILGLWTMDYSYLLKPSFEMSMREELPLEEQVKENEFDVSLPENDTEMIPDEAPPLLDVVVDEPDPTVDVAALDSAPEVEEPLEEDLLEKLPEEPVIEKVEEEMTDAQKKAIKEKKDRLKRIMDRNLKAQQTPRPVMRMPIRMRRGPLVMNRTPKSGGRGPNTGPVRDVRGRRMTSGSGQTGGLPGGSGQSGLRPGSGLTGLKPGTGLTGLPPATGKTGPPLPPSTGRTGPPPLPPGTGRTQPPCIDAPTMTNYDPDRLAFGGPDRAFGGRILYDERKLGGPRGGTFMRITMVTERTQSFRHWLKKGGPNGQPLGPEMNVGDRVVLRARTQGPVAPGVWVAMKEVGGNEQFARVIEGYGGGLPLNPAYRCPGPLPKRVNVIARSDNHFVLLFEETNTEDDDDPDWNDLVILVETTVRDCVPQGASPPGPSMGGR